MLHINKNSKYLGYAQITLSDELPGGAARGDMPPPARGCLRSDGPCAEGRRGSPVPPHPATPHQHQRPWQASAGGPSDSTLGKTKEGTLKNRRFWQYPRQKTRALKKGSVYKASESGVFKQLCEKFDFPSDFRFSWGCFEVKSGFPLYFPLFSSNIRNILTIFDENRATAPCIVYASRP